MTEKKLTGNQMFEMVKEECERSLGKVEEEGFCIKVKGMVNGNGIRLEMKNRIII